MGKKIKYVFLAVLCIFVLSFTANAETEHNITYDFGSADIRSDFITNPNPRSFFEGQILVLEAPSCPGFEFAGWYEDPEYTVPAESISADSNSDITLYSKWFKMSYTVSYVLTTPGIGILNSELQNPNTTTRLADESIFLQPPESASSHFTFEGWFTDSDYTEPITSVSAYTCENITLYAKWINTRYSVTYDLGDAASSVYPCVNNNPSMYTYSEETTLKKAETEDTAFSFEGWYADETFTKKVDSIVPGTEGDIILYAKWTITYYDVTYILADDSGISEENIQNSNPSLRSGAEELVLNDPISEDMSYTFAGWYTDKSFSEESKIESIKRTCTDNMTLYAKWVTAVYSVSYDYGIVNTSKCPITNNNPETYLFLSNTPLSDISADGFIFNGWYTDSRFQNHVSAIPSEAYGSITFYADFTEKTYTINYMLADKEVQESQVVNTNPSVRTTTEEVELQDPKTINALYAFDGWYYDSDFTERASKIDSYTTKNINLFAKWSKIVSYVPVWGDASLSNQLSSTDARIVLRFSAGIETLSELQQKVSDINNDGTVNATDARIILRLSAGLETIDDLTKLYGLPEIKLQDNEIIFD